MQIVTVSQMKEIEKETDAAGISYAEMMENAGKGVAQAIIESIDVDASKVVILVGPGNNGGDGLVAGRYLAEAGGKVTFYLTRERNKADDENYARVLRMDLPAIAAADDPQYSILHEIITSADVVIDALLGTGVDRPIKGEMKAILEQCGQALKENKSNRQKQNGLVSPIRSASNGDDLALIVAVDCPSGLNCDTGALDEAAIKADITVSFDSPKIGHFRFPGAGAVGDLVIADIKAPADLEARKKVDLELATFDTVKDLIPLPPLDAHKGSMGKVMIATGSINYTGAAALSGIGAYRAGAGLVTLAVPSAIHEPIASRLPEATFILLPHDLGVLNHDSARILCDALEGYDVLLVGPGLGRDEKTKMFLTTLLGGNKQAARSGIGFVHHENRSGDGRKTGNLPPLVLDADALNILAGLDQWPAMLPKDTILTPHPGEMARLVGCDMKTVMDDRLKTAKNAAKEWNQTVVLKGAFSIVASPDGRTAMIPFADPALATAGSGDVLAGCIAALRARGLSAFDAAVAGAYIHGAAGQMAGDSIGRTGVIAGDIAMFIATVMAEMYE